MTTTTSPAVANGLATHTTKSYTGPLGCHLRQQRTEAFLTTIRANITQLVADRHLFNDTERTTAATSVATCSCVARLQRWLRNTYRLSQQREAALYGAYATGTYVHIPAQA